MKVSTSDRALGDLGAYHELIIDRVHGVQIGRDIQDFGTCDDFVDSITDGG